MPARMSQTYKGPQGIFRACVVPQARHGQEADAADAGCIGKSADAAGAEKTRGTDPSVFSNGL